MGNLKAIIVFLLFWSIAIWCVRVVKRKRKKQIMEFGEKLPEMELVTDEEERKYICKNMVETGKLGNLFWGSVFLLNWWTIIRAIVEICREWSNGIAYELFGMSLFIAINWVIAENYRTTVIGLVGGQVGKTIGTAIVSVREGMIDEKGAAVGGIIGVPIGLVIATWGNMKFDKWYEEKKEQWKEKKEQEIPPYVILE